MTDDEARLHAFLADSEAERTAAMRANRRARSLLTDALHAADSGRARVARELVERAIAELDRGHG